MSRTLAQIRASHERNRELALRAARPRNPVSIPQPEGDYAQAGHMMALMQETAERDCRHLAAPAPEPDRVISRRRVGGGALPIPPAPARARGRDDRVRYLGELMPRVYDQRLDCWVREDPLGLL